MIKVGIIGATGYTGLELVRLLTRHPKVDLEMITSRSFAGKNIAEVYPSLQGIVNLKCEALEVERLANRVEVVFTALPHGVSMSIVPKLCKAGVKVIDLSGDYRYQRQKLYEEWYQQEHTSPQLLEEAIYGLPEINREQIKESSLVANPGCYPTSSILALAPAIKKKLVDLNSIIIDSKSGVTGAGREPSRVTHFTEVDESFKAYKVAQHRHTSEIENGLEFLTEEEVILSFTPHLVPMKRGILSTVYANLDQNSDLNTEEIIKLYQEFYRTHPFVRIQDINKMPDTKYVAGSNYCDIGLKVDLRTKRIIIVSVIDNLIKGASGQAIQNFNLMSGFAEETGLKFAGIFP
ncbi:MULTISPECIES: N-acetyl-gamma-glutamyl-phosphate reductase [unclassified Candidatus Frackibacter]|uniref:N-acetyl-gamma-glutamyl-phosphate reductase n=1 Tax=unclassified Candidatus Frackibacter TaxID=2648818 RepID=UPI0008904E87|nr:MULTISPECIES: N-acetyl-gamma-glutamyl-phosphate reductase [unclassified Candidatus Frackibacter]SDB97648.1 N-acetyl-gamma-glutamyl-phosphate reductase [Candidatus Frackibacter sp. WG11]SEM29351.1 N-acetyl-gamma-glutamyl-phosphate reductase [Candidatus Frackibacter sp. WG12]SFL34231.1 N-acetyl-gamma-glutamyl-phosphate reductase [Candidatus Frackibacter sp. WG13]